MYKLILPFRYLLKRHISYLAFVAVALCVFIVVVVMTVMRGLVTDFKQKNHRFVGDCVVGTDSLVGFAYYEDFVKVLEQQDFVHAVSPVVKSYGLINASGSKQNFGIEVMGINAACHSKVTAFTEMLYHTKDDPTRAFTPGNDPNLIGCIVGIDRWLSRDPNGIYKYESYRRRTKLAISCFPLTPKGALEKAGAGMVNTKTFYYTDTLHSGLARVDSSVIMLPLEQLQLLCGMASSVKRISSLYIKFKDDVRLETGRDKVAALWRDFVKEKADEKYAYLFKTVTVQTWKENRRTFIAAMEKEQTMLIAMFGLVGLTTVFVVFVVFYMIISHKSKDIGILKSVGVSNANLIQIYLVFAFFIGILGSAVGSLLGWRFLVNINSIENWLYGKFGFQMWDRTIYAIGDIPSHIEFKILIVIIVSAIIACLLGAIVPTWQAARLKPVESLQVNQL